MRGQLKIFALSDIHVDYRENLAWLKQLSQWEYQDDFLVLAGDISHRKGLLKQAFDIVKSVFKEVVYVPGNHELWLGSDTLSDSFEKFHVVLEIAEDCGIRTRTCHFESVSFVPLHGWYDGSFGIPSELLKRSWSDYTTCKWPAGYDDEKITHYFTQLNEENLEVENQLIISLSHFLPRIDIMPSRIPRKRRWVYPVLGATILERQIRQLGPDIHVYGHSHVNNRIKLEDILYINNAFGYPRETRISVKELVCIHEE